MKTLEKHGFIIEIILATAVLLVALLILYRNSTLPALGSVSRGSEHHATTTTTATSKVPTNIAFQNETTGSSTPGTFGSVVITGAAAGVMTFYDATTSDATKRDVVATSSLPVLASFPVSTAAGTYTFDTTFRKGLLFDVKGTMPTTTITWRE